MNTDGRGGLIERRNYLIDRFNVSFQGGVSWHCQCREFAGANSCRHTREAAGMREAQASILLHATCRTSTLARFAARPAPPAELLCTQPYRPPSGDLPS
jgi:hypothetical protein